MNAMNQSQFEENTCNWRKARGKPVTVSYDWIWFCFSFVEKVVQVVHANQSLKGNNAKPKRTRNYFRHYLQITERNNLFVNARRVFFF